MSILERLLDWLRSASGITFWPHLKFIDCLDIALVAFLIYRVLSWLRTTRAWTLLRGLLLLVFIALVSNFLQLNVTSWLLQNTMVYGVLAIVIVFQPEIRRALEGLGHGRLFNLISSDSKEKISQKTISEIVDALEKMAEVKTGALIVVEQEVPLGDYEQTGIPVDAVVTSQLLINIFEKNTPLHDGAVIISNNRVTYATCYLPLSEDLTISKEMGTRHRAALGLSEVSDARVFVVSEETGTISMAFKGSISREIDRSFIQNQFQERVSASHPAWQRWMEKRNGKEEKS
ncbi:MAG: diadenylate cyclase CdaA [Firmicutes bacterium]|nr:diadenylate cyclase CdaA [Bacillota bacterium]